MKASTEWKQKLRYLPHNLLGHPLMGLFQLCGLWSLSQWIHDWTRPR